ncbi:unnamed protein product [Effrenium voratum]|nr:unnamed protein product [Effrenium voratum]
MVATDETPEEFLCPIMQDVMEDPVVAADGASYERRAIEQWLSNGHCTSPLTNLPLSHEILLPNNNLRSAIQELLRSWPEEQRHELERRWRERRLPGAKSHVLPLEVMQDSHPAMLLLSLNRRLAFM